MGPVLGEADRMGLPCYLETMTTQNVAFYRRHGFEVIATGQAEARFPYWAMRRG